MEDHGLAGFTLFELLITLALIGILAGLALPSFQQLILNARLRSAAETVASDLRMARRAAVLENTPQQILLQYTDKSKWSFTYRQVLSLRRISSSDFPNITLARPAFSGHGGIRFSAIRGTANAGRLDFSTAFNKRLSVIISPLGRIRLCSNTDARYPPC